MLVLTFDNVLRLVTQEQHAMVSGMLAHAWRGVAQKTGLHGLLVHAAGMHDNPWRHADESPRLDAKRGLPHDFITFPTTEKMLMYGGGIDQLERVHPYVAALVSLHYTTFAGTVKWETFQQQEQRRRTRLRQWLPDTLSEESRWQRDLAYIKLFDNLSLFFCLTAPGIDPETVPSWIDPSGWAKDPESGAEMSLDWIDANTVSMRPFPFASPMNLHFYYKEIPRTACKNQKELAKAWTAQTPQLWTIALQP